MGGKNKKPRNFQTPQIYNSLQNKEENTNGTAEMMNKPKLTIFLFQKDPNLKEKI